MNKLYHLRYLLFLLFLLSCRGRFYRVPSSAMEGTIMTGEHITVIQADSFKRNDIVVFDHFATDYSSGPDEEGNFKEHWEKRVHRLIAYSGDVLEIKKGDVYINGELVSPPPKAKLRYEVLSTVSLEEFMEIDPYTTSITKRGDTMAYQADLTTEQAFNYRQRKPAIVSVNKIAPVFNSPDTSIVRSSAGDTWTTYDLGPLRIPAPGETITINTINFKLYHNIPGVHTGNYLLKEKLYFVMGDNRYAAEDSRYIGFIPHSKMDGVVK
ncbi:MAG: signal peptidase I [Chitinophagaceae bacterium]|nr:signal peptidase I [Chitinophagaceae bacterium]